MSFSLRRFPFFEHRKIITGFTWLASTVAILIPAILELNPLGDQKSQKKKARDDAQDAFDTTLNKLDSVKAQILEANQRVGDLDCAIPGYPKFNADIEAFQKRISESSATPEEKLKALWQIQYLADKTVPTVTVEGKSFQDYRNEWDYYYSCFWHSCEKNQCCYDWGYHLVSHTYYYNEITTITNEYASIIQGISATPFTLPSLNCGYYSRQFGLRQPITTLFDESVHIESGDKRAGSTYITFTRKWGSLLSAFFGLDDTKTRTQMFVLRASDHGISAMDLVSQLSKFLATAIAAFQVTGPDYPALQDSIQKSIPKLIDTANSLNNTLYNQAIVLGDAQDALNAVKGEFSLGLKVYLPLLFGLPIVLSGLTYYFLTNCKVDREALDVQSEDLEQGTPVLPAIPPVDYHTFNAENYRPIPNAPSLPDLSSVPATIFSPRASVDIAKKDNAEKQSLGHRVK